jgi:AcrR family transcriptional regulator
MQDEPAAGLGQPLRADARRNHDALVEAAASVFGVAGVDAPIKDIADQAGVGVGTFYRRFPRRSDLIFAVLRYEVESCAEAADILAQQHPPFEALTLWIDRLLDLIVTKRGLAAALQSEAPAYAALRGDFEARLVPSLERLMETALAEIGAEITATELWRAIALLCAPATPVDFEQSRRMVALLVRGLHASVHPITDDSAAADRWEPQPKTSLRLRQHGVDGAAKRLDAQRGRNPT